MFWTCKVNALLLRERPGIRISTATQLRGGPHGEAGLLKATAILVMAGEDAAMCPPTVINHYRTTAGFLSSMGKMAAERIRTFQNWLWLAEQFEREPDYSERYKVQEIMGSLIGDAAVIL